MIKPRATKGIYCGQCSVQHLCIAHQLDVRDIQKLDEIISVVKCVNRNNHISRIHDTLINLYAVHKGSCKEYWIDEDGNECVTNFYFPGDIIGIESVAKKKHIFSVAALESTELCVIPIESFLQMLSEYPNILQRFLTINSLKMQNDQSTRMGVTVSEKICDFLLNVSNRMNERMPAANKFRLSMSQIDISNYLGIAYETVNRILKDLSHKKIISLKNKTLEILNYSELQNLGKLDYQK